MITLWRVEPWASCQAAHEEKTGQLPGRARRRLQRGRRHPGDLAQGLFQLDEQGQPPLSQRGGSGGMDPGQTGEPGDGVAHLRVVLHGARPQRVGAEVHRELAVAEPREVGHQVAFGHFGQRHRPGAPVLGGDQVLDRRLGQARGPKRPRLPAGMGQLEEGGLGLPAQQRSAGGLSPGCGLDDGAGINGRAGLGHQATAFANASA